MTVKNILGLGLIEDGTEVFVRDKDSHVLAHGNWYQDNVLEYMNWEAESFTWQDDNKFYINVKQKGSGYMSEKREEDSIITEVCEEICNNYCKYSDTKHDGKINSDDTCEHYEDCILNKLQQ